MTESYRILVTGSRDWDDPATLAFHLGRAVGEAHREGRPAVIVHGACPEGADAMADHLARSYRLTTEPHPADWDRYGKAAGPRRNAGMVALGADECLAFIRNNSPGATGCADAAERAGIPVQRFRRTG